MEIAGPHFEINETVEPTPDAAIKPAGRVGRVESRAWTEFRDQPGYWRYTIRWPGGGTSSESAKHLQPADRITCDLKVVVSGAPFKIETYTTQTVEEVVEVALAKAGIPHPDTPANPTWQLRTAEGRQLTHLVGDAELVDGETTLFLNPKIGGGGGEQGGEVVEATIVESSDPSQVGRTGKVPVEALVSGGARPAWAGEPPAEGKVPAGTRELCIVLDHGTPAGPKFVELETQDGVSVGGFESRWKPGTEIQRIVIPYGRDDAWVSEVAYQAAGAATRPLLEDHPDYVFPAERVRDAVAELLKDFGIARACGDCQEEQLEIGRAAVAEDALSDNEEANDGD